MKPNLLQTVDSNNSFVIAWKKPYRLLFDCPYISFMFVIISSSHAKDYAFPNKAPAFVDDTQPILSVVLLSSLSSLPPEPPHINPPQALSLFNLARSAYNARLIHIAYPSNEQQKEQNGSGHIIGQTMADNRATLKDASR